MIDQKQTNNLCLRWKGKQRRIGITGGIASGKTIIGDFLFQAKQWPILDADLYAHEALSAESEIVKKVWLRYGSKIIKGTGLTRCRLLVLGGRGRHRGLDRRLSFGRVTHPSRSGRRGVRRLGAGRRGGNMSEERRYW